jgi:hypothetical protein
MHAVKVGDMSCVTAAGQGPGRARLPRWQTVQIGLADHHNLAAARFALRAHVSSGEAAILTPAGGHARGVEAQTAPRR